MSFLRMAALSGMAMLALGGCANGDDPSSLNGALRGGSGADSGTVLTATATAGATACTSSSGGTVAMTGQVQTTGSVDSVNIMAAVDGGQAAQVGTIAPTDFSHDGRDKTANYSISLSLPNGTHSVELCFVQSGAQGREPKATCVTTAVTVACANYCASQGVFGDLVGNPNLCNGGGPPHVPVHVKGEFGDSAQLTISGPSGYSHAATLRRAGDSCVYQYNWDTAGNGGAGAYQFKAVGTNGTAYNFSASLNCR